MPSVAAYLVARLAKEGIAHCFGVPGDFAFPLCDAVENSDVIQWVGCSSELEAAYAADGYARVAAGRSAMLLTTYAVGELSALNGVMGAKSERSCVFHIVGAPARPLQRSHQIVHHTMGDGLFEFAANLSAQAACVSASLTPENCVAELERVVACARAESRPAYILVAADDAVAEVVQNVSLSTPAPLENRSEELDAAVSCIRGRIASARSMCVLPSYLVSRFKLQDRTIRLVEALQCPFATMLMDKGVLGETHPQFVGMYSGALSSPEVLLAVEGADLMLDVGGVVWHDINTVAYTGHVAPEKMITIGIHAVTVGGPGGRTFAVKLGDVLTRLAQEPAPKQFGYVKAASAAPPQEEGASSGAITAAAMYPRLGAFLRAGDLIVVETGSMSYGLGPLRLPAGAEVVAQTLWGSIGWATGEGSVV